MVVGLPWKFWGSIFRNFQFDADLELASLGVQWERVKQHRADEGDVGRLAGNTQNTQVNCDNLDFLVDGNLDNVENYAYFLCGWLL